MTNLMIQKILLETISACTQVQTLTCASGNFVLPAVYQIVLTSAAADCSVAAPRLMVLLRK